MGKKYYAVKAGFKPGIYTSWDECKKQTDGFSKPVFKGFMTLTEAQAFIGETNENVVQDESKKVNSCFDIESLPEIYAFTDGSYNAATKVYGFGGFLHVGNEKDDIPIRGHGNDPQEAVSRNVAGEVHGAMEAIRIAGDMNLKELTIFYDYMGIELWPTRGWKANKPLTKKYVAVYDEYSQKLKINFCHVKAHTGIPGNELADTIAKEEVGLL